MSDYRRGLRLALQCITFVYLESANSYSFITISPTRQTSTACTYILNLLRAYQFCGIGFQRHTFPFLWVSQLSTLIFPLYLCSLHRLWNVFLYNPNSCPIFFSVSNSSARNHQKTKFTVLLFLQEWLLYLLHNNSCIYRSPLICRCITPDAHIIMLNSSLLSSPWNLVVPFCY
jgi:hypothetical protein